MTNEVNFINDNKLERSERNSLVPKLIFNLFINT